MTSVKRYRKIVVVPDTEIQIIKEKLPSDPTPCAMVVTKKGTGKFGHYVIRQLPHDNPAKVGQKIFGELIIGISRI